MYIQSTLLLVDIVENALLDLVTWLEDMVEALRALPRPNKIPGLWGLDQSDSCLVTIVT
jgi:hypothetical protein